MSAIKGEDPRYYYPPEGSRAAPSCSTVFFLNPHLTLLRGPISGVIVVFSGRGPYFQWCGCILRASSAASHLESCSSAPSNYGPHTKLCVHESATA
jgi:hypothetical protein